MWVIAAPPVLPIMNPCDSLGKTLGVRTPDPLIRCYTLIY